MEKSIQLTRVIKKGNQKKNEISRPIFYFFGDCGGQYYHSFRNNAISEIMLDDFTNT